MGWHEGHLLALDIESTSKDPLTARVVTASLVVIDPIQSVVTKRATALEWMVAVDEEIPESATATHGITTEEARARGRPLSDVLSELDIALREMWNSAVPLLAMNASYDLTVIACERARCDMNPLEITEQTPVIDLFVCDKAMDPYRRGSRRLESLCEHYGVTIGMAHNSTADALATARASWKLAKRYPELANMELADLHRQQVKWYREQSLSLAAYWRTPRAVEKIEFDHSAGAVTRDEADELIRTLPQRADDVERNADGWPMRARVAPLVTRVVHLKRDSYDVRIDRTTKWGNPFRIGRDGTRAEVLKKYEYWVREQPPLIAALHELRGKVLGCWCAPEACHGDVLARLAED